MNNFYKIFYDTYVVVAKVELLCAKRCKMYSTLSSELCRMSECSGLTSDVVSVWNARCKFVLRPKQAR